ncbi:MAG TPA: flagellar biosynthesis protein FliQ [Planctomycetes bacterium]|nr:flagellar biosynthesis protein FliQ [Planctomycetota bacterium]
MDIEAAVDVAQQALWISAMILAPLLGSALLVGLLVSIFQAVTQINELTLTFIPKMAAVLGVTFLLLPWFISVLVAYTRETIQLLGGI